MFSRFFLHLHAFITAGSRLLLAKLIQQGQALVRLRKVGVSLSRSSTLDAGA